MQSTRIPFDELKSLLKKVLLEHKFPEAEAEKCADIFAVNTLEGVYSHGVNRFPRFIDYIRRGFVKVGATPELVHSAGALEQWQGNLAPGPLNAIFCTNRAIEIAETNGIGCVAIANTNHWMRGGAYGWQAARSCSCCRTQDRPSCWPSSRTSCPISGARGS